MSKKNVIKGFILLRKYPGCNKKIGAFEPYTTGEFLNYPEIWKPIYDNTTIEEQLPSVSIGDVKIELDEKQKRELSEAVNAFGVNSKDVESLLMKFAMQNRAQYSDAMHKKHEQSKKVVREKTYTIKETTYESGESTLQRINDGFNPIELLGLTSLASQEIISQMKGIIKPDVVKRTVIVEEKK